MTDIIKPDFNVCLNALRDADPAQFGILGKTIPINTKDPVRRLALELNNPFCLALVGQPGSGKSFTLGSIIEMLLIQNPNANFLPAPWFAGVFHWADSDDYWPELTASVLPSGDTFLNGLLMKDYQIQPMGIPRVIIMVPHHLLKTRRNAPQYKGVEVHPIRLSPKRMTAQQWRYLMGVFGRSDDLAIQALGEIIRTLAFTTDESGEQVMRPVPPNEIEDHINRAPLSESEKNRARMRLTLARRFIATSDDEKTLDQFVSQGTMVIYDLRDDFMSKDEALCLMLVILQQVSGTTGPGGKIFPKFLCFDEAHQYMSNPDLIEGIISVIRVMRHKSCAIGIASQDPMSVPERALQLANLQIVHKVVPPEWVRYLRNQNQAFADVTSAMTSKLKSGQCYLWAGKASDDKFMEEAILSSIRPRFSKHGGFTKSATGT
jgi:DNA helicase HerA-like ATPase